MVLAAVLVAAIFQRSRRTRISAANAMSEVADSGRAVVVTRRPPPTRRERRAARRAPGEGGER